VKNSKKGPNLYIIAGPNGAGKTTFAREFLPHYADCYEFINADLIAGGLSPFVPERAAIKSGKLMLEQIHILSQQGVDFGFETTLAGKSYRHLLQELKIRGYYITLFYLWLPSVELALKRIADRVRRGGHNVPANTVRRRFNRGLYNLFYLYRPLLNVWVLFDNASDTPLQIASEKSGKLNICVPDLFARIQKGVKKK
jgi:predicted ABC-type ATPase